MPVGASPRFTVVSPPQIIHTPPLLGCGMEDPTQLYKRLSATLAPAVDASPAIGVPTTRGARPNSAARLATASMANLLLATYSIATFAKAGSPGFGVSAVLPETAETTRSRAASGSFDQRPAPSRSSRTCAAVVGSGTQGPDPMDARSSPITSETMYTRTRAGNRARPRRPAPQRENRFRIRFMATISRPEPSSRE